MYFRLCLHVDTSSFRLFKVARCGFVIIRCFSAVHKPHRLVVLEYGFALARILHVIVKASIKKEAALWVHGVTYSGGEE